MSTDRQHLQHKANTDPLTGIHNRSGFQFLLKNCLAKSKGGGALFILDLDHFKQVNDTLGHPTGDLLLKDIAQILQGIFRSNDIVARLGGDEFVIYADGLEENSTIKDKAEMIIQKCTRDYTQPDGTVFSVTASIGIACYPQDGATLKDLYKHADEALYSAKKDGRNRFTFYQAP